MKSLILSAGTYEATTKGVWSGASGYVYTEAVYIFEFVNMQAQYYPSFMDETQSQIEAVGQLAYNNTLPANIIYWFVAVFCIFIWPKACLLLATCFTTG